MNELESNKMKQRLTSRRILSLTTGILFLLNAFAVTYLFLSMNALALAFLYFIVNLVVGTYAVIQYRITSKQKVAERQSKLRIQEKIDAIELALRGQQMAHQKLELQQENISRLQTKCFHEVHKQH